MYKHHRIENPFQFRHTCWFCGEPSNQEYLYPPEKLYIPDCVHPAISVNCCGECLPFANKSTEQDIWRVRRDVKRKLMEKYQKHLAIGIHWTKQELEESELEGKIFEGFKKSGWAMYEIAKARVNFAGWPLEASGISIEEHRNTCPDEFVFDGVVFPGLEQAISHYASSFSLHKAYFKRVLTILGKENFAQAVRFCRLLVGATPDERDLALKSLNKI